jgi:hypothetical protein
MFIFKKNIMKKISTILVFVIAAMVLFTACSKKDASPTYSMTATVASHSFSASGLSVTANNSGGLLGMAGVTSAYESISISFSTATVKVGTYAIDTASMNMCLYGSAAGALPVTAASGSVTFTAVSPSLVGTFVITLIDGTKITGGKFTIKSPF